MRSSGCTPGAPSSWSRAPNPLELLAEDIEFVRTFWMPMPAENLALMMGRV